jgi:hypothetical protein
LLLRTKEEPVPSIIEEMAAAGAADPDINTDAPPAKPKKPAGRKPVPKDEDKRARFERLAVPRVQRAIESIHRIGLMGGANKHRYAYGPSDVDAILSELTEAVAQAGARLMRKPQQLKLFSLPRQKNGGE